jgi:CRISPR type III-associated protein (TIGR04423 family)
MRVTEIKKSNYQGYLWYSDKKTPESFSNKECGGELDAEKNPFIIEGQLYDSENRISYSIKYVDGEYFINEYKVKETDLIDKDNDQVSYKAHRMGEGVVLEFLQYFREVEDELCESMKVLQPAEKVFIGFKEK